MRVAQCREMSGVFWCDHPEQPLSTLMVSSENSRKAWTGKERREALRAAKNSIDGTGVVAFVARKYDLLQRDGKPEILFELEGGVAMDDTRSRLRCHGGWGVKLQIVL
jgi:hypothetical protein